MDDLEICKRIARIEYPLCAYEWTKGKCDLTLHGETYNPLTDDALCFRLMVKYKVELDFHRDVAEIYKCPEYNESTTATVVFNGNVNRAICLAIIASKENQDD